MPTYLNSPNTIKTAAIALAAAIALPGCSLFHEDLPECPSGIDVTFSYDYNIPRTDLFVDDVHAVTVYVFDAATGILVAQKEEYGEHLDREGYVMHLDVPAGRYLLHAVAGEADYATLTSTSGAAFRRSDVAGKTLADFGLHLDRANGRVEQNGEPLSVIYQSLRTEEVTVEGEVDGTVQATAHIELMRLVNTLKLSYSRADYPGYIDPADFSVTLTDRNGHILYDNSVDVDDEDMTYMPYATSATEVDDAGVMRVVHYINFARAVFENGTPEAVLAITDRLTGQSYTLDNVYSLLAEGRAAPGRAEYGYSHQEYMDRENYFEIELPPLDGYVIKYATVKVSVLSWAKHVQLVDLGI